MGYIKEHGMGDGGNQWAETGLNESSDWLASVTIDQSAFFMAVTSWHGLYGKGRGWGRVHETWEDSYHNTIQLLQHCGWVHTFQLTVVQFNAGDGGVLLRDNTSLSLVNAFNECSQMYGLNSQARLVKNIPYFINCFKMLDSIRFLALYIILYV